MSDVAVPSDEKLYDRALKATLKYFKDFKVGKSALAKALDFSKREYFRTGWIVGFRAGLKSRRRFK